ncbi:hypothetical protein KSZ_77790 [Dictyobacter formicarum]|uniref:Uncharacterized protein n=1 Tax=Dictyobacter formicarum TaxID=2778368 RepID=A0ABQ3VVC7_9CHLR|nr:hypothetical protein KSZ_77790 [Dictyobacter formicarum]
MDERMGHRKNMIVAIIDAVTPWYYPDQVKGPHTFRLCSQPGFPELPCRR